MKKLVIAAIALASTGYASAQATQAEAKTAETNIVADEQVKKTPVKLDELPEAVKKSLGGDAYMGWTPTAAFWIEAKVPYYEIELSKGDDKSTVRMDKMGQIVK